MIKPAFVTPVQADTDHDGGLVLLVGADQELIAEVWSITTEETTQLVNMLNTHGELLAALKGLLPSVDAEIEQRKSGGNAEDWQALAALSNAAHAAVRKASQYPATIPTQGAPAGMEVSP